MASDHQNPNSNLDTMITTFMEITSSTAQQAQFFLESHNFDVDAAVETFFESSSPAAATATIGTGTVAGESASSGSISPSRSRSRSRSRSPVPAGDRSQYNLRSRKPNVDSSNRTRSGRIRTFSDINRSSGGEGSDSDSDADQPPQYFTGGMKSGMLVQDPHNVDDVDAFFEQARQMGAVEGPADVVQPSSSSRSFTGTARLLSGETVPSASHEQPLETITHTITFWRDGFTVNDGPLRRFHDPENASFLENVKNSDCPKELEPADRSTSVRLNLVRKDEDYPQPKKRQTPFQGVGRTLSTSCSDPSEPAADPADMNAAPTPMMGLIVDQNLPSTSIQLRLADGTRMVSRFNHHHTIRDIHAFIDASRPGRVGTYALQTVGFPPKKLTELDQTIEQAGIANSVIIQKS